MNYFYALTPRMHWWLIDKYENKMYTLASDSTALFSLNAFSTTDGQMIFRILNSTLSAISYSSIIAFDSQETHIFMGISDTSSIGVIWKFEISSLNLECLRMAGTINPILFDLVSNDIFYTSLLISTTDLVLQRFM